jgi:hypothetical protein
MEHATTELAWSSHSNVAEEQPVGENAQISCHFATLVVR